MGLLVSIVFIMMMIFVFNYLIVLVDGISLFIGLSGVGVLYVICYYCVLLLDGVMVVYVDIGGKFWEFCCVGC